MANPSDAQLQAFVNTSFEPVDYLNNTLPSLALSNHPHASKTASSVPLSDLSTQTQSLVSQLSAQNARWSNTLVQVTDEILRSGGRLAYEVEVLRGESIGLSETLTDVLQDDIAKFSPDPSKAIRNAIGNAEAGVEGAQSPEKQDTSTFDPPYLIHLRMLTQVRSRLEEVIQTFGEAMEWPLPPSEVSIASSFISVSGPDSSADSYSREEKGQEVAKRLRSQVTELLDSRGGGEDGLQAAEKRVDELGTLAAVWKGTAEEKARNKFVDSLAKQVDERRKVLEIQSGEIRPRPSFEQSPRRAPSNKGGRPSIDQNHEERGSEGPSGFMRNLQRLRDEIYLE